jgi:hypothetical protein
LSDEAFRAAVTQAVALEVRVSADAVSLQGIGLTIANNTGWVGLAPTRRRLLVRATLARSPTIAASWAKLKRCCFIRSR